ncbi:MAG: MFS transporter [Proteobacteria bacterium]|uniref:MFS transporter n=1 Tax=Rudaea sp. TaxID=2136325 RepID=UPI001D315A61|nr:MFS transporter [Pseudomonadota bacterium]MBS0568491.1 MFS transporter [Pseudomonadota bacterium]
MNTNSAVASGNASTAIPAGSGTALGVLAAVSSSHFLNDLIQSLLPSIYPILKSNYALDFGQIGLLTFTYQLTASLLQPLVGAYTDRKPLPYSLPAGMGFTLCGLLLLSQAGSFPMLLLAAALIGTGSSIFHPESSRIARLASGGRHGFAQSFFQVGGNAGSALGPLLAAFVILPHGQGALAWVSALALAGIVLLTRVGLWYAPRAKPKAARAATAAATLPKRKVMIAIGVLLALIFSKYFYLISLSNYYTFYLIEKFHVSTQSAQIHLFYFLGAVALGTLVGGPIGDKVGRKWVIWVSILGVLPFSLLLPHAGLFWTTALTVVIGLILSSAFSAILVYATELLPGNVGMVAGMFFGFAFGMGGIAAAVLGELADLNGIEYVYRLCAWLPAIGLLTAFLPDLHRPRIAPGMA